MDSNEPSRRPHGRAPSIQMTSYKTSREHSEIYFSAPAYPRGIGISTRGPIYGWWSGRNYDVSIGFYGRHGAIVMYVLDGDL